MGFLNEVSYLIVGFSVVLIPLFLLAISRQTLFNRLCLTFVFLTVYVPALCYISYSNPSWYLLFAFLISIPPLLIFSRIKISPAKSSTFSVRVYVAILLVAIFATTLALVTRVGLSSVSFDLYGTYEFRRDAFTSIGVGLNRSLSIATTFFLPLLMIYAFSLKSRLRLIVFMLAGLSAVIIFGYWHHKSAIFLPFAAVSLYFFLNKGVPEYRLLLAFVLLSLILAIEAATYFILDIPGEAALNGLVGRRALFVPSLLTDYYIDFFSRNEMIMWRDLTKAFTGVPPAYDSAPAFLIGQLYFGDDDMSANVGFIGSGYAHAGLFGVVLYSCILGLIIAYLSSQARRLGPAFVFSVTAFVVHTAFASSDLPTALLAHGLLISLVILPFLASLNVR